jgi:hypothetical protein
MLTSEHDAMTPADAIEAAEVAEAETAYRLQFGREMYRAGYAQAEADMASRWHEIARTAVRGPAHADLEAERWGPSGREHFGDPRPGDYRGRSAEAAEAEPELEASA